MASKYNTIASKPPQEIGLAALAVVSGSLLSGQTSLFLARLHGVTCLNSGTGALMSLSAFVIPVFLDTNGDPGHTLRQLVWLYHYGHIYLAAFCIATCGLYGFSAVSSKAADRKQWTRYALAAVSTFCMVPFTWLILKPKNNKIFRLEGSESVAEVGFVRDLVVRWAWLHVVRSMSPLLGTFLGFTCLLQEVRGN